MASGPARRGRAPPQFPRGIAYWHADRRSCDFGLFARQGSYMAVPNAAALLDQFTAAGIAVELTHRSKRRLFLFDQNIPAKTWAAWRGTRKAPSPGENDGADFVESPPFPQLRSRQSSGAHLIQ